MRILLIVITLFSFSAIAQESDRLTQIENRLDDLEINSAFRRIKMSGSFMNHFESFSAKREKTDLPVAVSGDDTNNYMNPMLMRVQLNFDAKVSKSVQFYSSIGMSKFNNFQGRQSRLSNLNGRSFRSVDGSYGAEGPGAQFDVAYVSWNEEDSPWTFAMGRMTTNNGPPFNQPDGVGRAGTYPGFAYNAVLDGAALIYNFKNWMPEHHQLKARFFHTPFMTSSLTDKSRPLNDSNTTGSVGDTSTTDADEVVEANAQMNTLLLEYGIKKLSWVKKLNIYILTISIDGVYSEVNQRPETSSIPDLAQAGVEYNYANINTAYIGLDNLMETGISLSWSYKQSNVRTTGQDEAIPSSANLYTMNYTFDNGFNAGDILGVEYIVADQAHNTTDFTTMYVNDFYNLRNGDGTHIFYTKRIGGNQIVRLGHFTYNEGDSSFYGSNIETTVASSYARWMVFF